MGPQTLKPHLLCESEAPQDHLEWPTLRMHINHRKCNTTLFSGSNMPVISHLGAGHKCHIPVSGIVVAKDADSSRPGPKSPSWVYQLHTTRTIVRFGRTKNHHAQTTLEPLYRFLKNCKPLNIFLHKDEDKSV